MFDFNRRWGRSSTLVDDFARRRIVIDHLIVAFYAVDCFGKFLVEGAFLSLRGEQLRLWLVDHLADHFSKFEWVRLFHLVFFLN